MLVGEAGLLDEEMGPENYNILTRELCSILLYTLMVNVRSITFACSTGQSRGQNASSDIYKNHASCMTRWDRSTCMPIIHMQ